MTNSNLPQTAVADTGSRKQTKTHVSKDGKWKSWPELRLLQYLPSGIYFARVKPKGSRIVKRASLETDVFQVAKDRLKAKIDELRQPKTEIITVGYGRDAFVTETNNKHELAELSRAYRLRCVDRIFKSWPGLENRPVDSITLPECEAWARDYLSKYSRQFFNHSLYFFRQMLTLAGLGREKNPLFKIKRRGVFAKELKLPNDEQFNRILHEIETVGPCDPQARDRADFVRFLAYSGLRLSEAKATQWGDVDWQKNELAVHCAKRRETSGASRVRVVPLVPAMKMLLTRLHAEQNPSPEQPICRVTICRKPLVRACKRVGCAPLTHHTLRHQFASLCIESGIDIPTVSKWLGHLDGGALAMRVYGHLRNEHSQQMAQRLTFGLPQLALPDAK